MTDSAITQNSDGLAQLQALLRLRRVLRQSVPQLLQAFQVLVSGRAPSRFITPTQSGERQGTIIELLPPERQAELERLIFTAFDGNTCRLKDFEAFVQLLEVTQRILMDHWSSLPNDVQQTLVDASQAILDLLPNAAIGRVQPVPTETIRVGMQEPFALFQRYLGTTWALLKNPTRTLEYFKQLQVVLPKFARTVQRLNDREQKYAEFQRELAQFPDWDRAEQIERNQGAIAWIRERRRKDELMTEEENQRAKEEFELFKQLIDESRPPGNKLFSEK